MSNWKVISSISNKKTNNNLYVTQVVFSENTYMKGVSKFGTPFLFRVLTIPCIGIRGAIRNTLNPKPYQVALALYEYQWTNVMDGSHET